MLNGTEQELPEVYVTESQAESDKVQTDWIGADEQIRAHRHDLKQAAMRLGVAAIAHMVGLDETTLRNQLDWRPRPDGKGCWKPSADVVFRVFDLDRRFREQMLVQTHERIAPEEDLEPMDFARAIVAKAIAGEFHPNDRMEILDLFQRVKKNSTKGGAAK